jgi:hypothetical protein
VLVACEEGAGGGGGGAEVEVDAAAADPPPIGLDPAAAELSPPPPASFPPSISLFNTSSALAYPLFLRKLTTNSLYAGSDSDTPASSGGTGEAAVEGRGVGLDEGLGAIGKGLR